MVLDRVVAGKCNRLPYTEWIMESIQNKHFGKTTGIPLWHWAGDGLYYKVTNVSLDTFLQTDLKLPGRFFLNSDCDENRDNEEVNYYLEGLLVNMSRTEEFIPPQTSEQALCTESSLMMGPFNYANLSATFVAGLLSLFDDLTLLYDPSDGNVNKTEIAQQLMEVRMVFFPTEHYIMFV